MDKKTEAEIITLARLWESEDGKLAIQKMTDMKQANLDEAIHFAKDSTHNTSVLRDTILADVYRASGIDAVLGDIEIIKLKAKEIQKKRNAYEP